MGFMAYTGGGTMEGKSIEEQCEEYRYFIKQMISEINNVHDLQHIFTVAKVRYEKI